MKRKKIEDEDVGIGKGCIGMMVMHQKSELSNKKMKRAWLTHKRKILKKQTKYET